MTDGDDGINLKRYILFVASLSSRLAETFQVTLAKFKSKELVMLKDGRKLSKFIWKLWPNKNLFTYNYELFNWADEYMRLMETGHSMVLHHFLWEETLWKETLSTLQNFRNCGTSKNKYLGLYNAFELMETDALSCQSFEIGFIIKTKSENFSY